MMFKAYSRNSSILTSRFFKSLLLLTVSICSYQFVSAGETINYESEAIFNAGSGDFAPYYIASNRHGILTQSSNALLRIEANKSLDLSQRFSYAFGAEVIGGYADKTEYSRYDASSASFYKHSQAPASIWIQ